VAVRVYIVAAYPTIRAGLAALVREQPEWSLAGQGAPETALSAGPTLAAAGEGPPDIVLADLDGINDGGAVEALLDALRPRSGFVALLAPSAAEVRGRPARATGATLGEVARAAESDELAFAALLRDATTEEIVAAMRAVGGGLVTLDRRLAHGALTAPERVTVPTELAAGAGEPLTPRERDVLQLMAEGLPNKLIAARLSISEHTAKFHVSAIMTKLGAASRTEAVTIGARRGLLIL
jgi:DNA-binding NarL/FixJ family response regulator